MNKFEYQNPKSETNSNDQNTKLFEHLKIRILILECRIVSNFVLRISNLQFQKGQALITLIFFVLIAITITSGAIIMIAVNSTSLGKLQEGNISHNVAEAGIENALLRLLRDPNYTGETLTIESTTVIITVTGSNPKTITAVGTNGNFKRTVQAQMTYTNGYYTFSNWKEI